MSEIVKRTLTIDAGNVQSYGAGDSGMSLNYEVSKTQTVALRVKTNSELSYTLNSTAKDVLYPNSTAKPAKADVTIALDRPSTLGYKLVYGNIKFGGTAVINESINTSDGGSFTNAGITNNAIVNSNKSTAITVGLYGEESSFQSFVEWFEISLYFNKYSFYTSSTTGISSTTVNNASTATGYDGDKITYNATVLDGYSFIGWYKNNILYSTQQNNLSYTVNGEDVTLEARAVPNEIYINYNNSVINKQRVVTSIPFMYKNNLKYTMTQGNKKVLQCKNKLMEDDYYINGKKLECARKLMADDVVVYYPNPLINLINPYAFSLENVTTANGEYIFSSDTTAMINQSMPTPIAGHKYYGRCYAKAPAGSAFADGRFEYYKTDGANLIFSSMTEATKDNQWHLYSRILSFDSVASTDGWKLRSFTVNGTANSYRKEMMIVDLTAAFGAGNEPSKDWCDANIIYNNLG